MPKKHREPSLLEVALSSRWPVAATITAARFAAFLIAPGILASNVFLVALAPLARTVPLLACCGFGVIALVMFVMEKRARHGANARSAWHRCANYWA